MFRIAHISDLHIAKISYNPLQIFSKRWLGNVNLLLSRKKHFATNQLWELPQLFETLKIDYLIVAGDISCTSYKKEFQTAKKLFDEIKTRGTKTLILPGNHDLYTKHSYRKKTFYDFFQNYLPTQSLNFNLKKDGIEAFALEDNWWYIGIDTAVATSLISSRGLFSKDLEENLLITLEKVPKNASIILVNHFPFSETEYSCRKILVRGKKLEEILKKHPQIKFFLHGHSHCHRIADLRKQHLPISLDSGCSAHNAIGSWNYLEFSKNHCSLQVYKWKHAHWTSVEKKNFQI